MVGRWVTVQRTDQSVTRGSCRLRVRWGGWPLSRLDRSGKVCDVPAGSRGCPIGQSLKGTGRIETG